MATKTPFSKTAAAADSPPETAADEKQKGPHTDDQPAMNPSVDPSTMGRTLGWGDPNQAAAPTASEPDLSTPEDVIAALQTHPGILDTYSKQEIIAMLKGASTSKAAAPATATTS